MAYRRRILGRRRLKYNASFSILAKEDKNEIKRYLSQFYPETPKRFTTALKKHISILKENPYMYPIYPENPDYRRMVVDNYIVLYKIIDDEKKIEIFRILRASWDLPKYL
jgi:addiction module RelE/StbE family toxin